MMGYTTIESMLRRFEREGRRDAFPLSDSFPQWQSVGWKTLSGLLGLQYLEAVEADPVIIGREEAAAGFGLVPGKRTILVIGGSLGARSLNESILGNLQLVRQQKDVQFIWQTGKIYIDEVKAAITSFTGEPMRNVHSPSLPNLYVSDFIKDMSMAYAASDLVVSRAGAGSISEFCLLGKPVILVPSPNVAEDHQTKNALALVDKGAAIYVKDADAPTQLLDTALKTVTDEAQLHKLSEHIIRLALPNSANLIAQEVLKLIE